MCNLNNHLKRRHPPSACVRSNYDLYKWNKHYNKAVTRGDCPHNRCDRTRECVWSANRYKHMPKVCALATCDRKHTYTHSDTRAARSRPPSVCVRLFSERAYICRIFVVRRERPSKITHLLLITLSHANYQIICCSRWSSPYAHAHAQHDECLSMFVFILEYYLNVI